MDELTRARLLYEQTALRLSNQRATLDAIRGRVGTLFAAALVATSFLGAVAKEGRSADLELGWAGITAMLAFGTVAVISAAMFGVRNMRFGLQYGEMLAPVAGDRTSEDRVAEAETYRQFAGLLEGHYGSNYRQMKWMFRGMRVLPYVVSAELLLWVLEFSDLSQWQQGVLYALLGALAALPLLELWRERRRAERAKQDTAEEPESPLAEVA